MINASPRSVLCLLDDVAWRAKYGTGHAGAAGAHGNADEAVQGPRRGDLAGRLVERLSIEEAEGCLRKLDELLITGDVLAMADAQDLAGECGSTEQQCDAVLLDDVAWRVRYGTGHAVAAGAHGNADEAVQEPRRGDLAGRLVERLSIEAEGCLRKPDSSAFLKKKNFNFFFWKNLFF